MKINKLNIINKKIKNEENKLIKNCLRLKK